MRVSFDHRDPGTAEARWEAAGLQAKARPLGLGVERLIVLSAHPDDETLGAGGLIAIAAAAGVDVSVIVATDGEASHPGSADARTLGLRRRLEVVAAVTELAPGARMRFLGLPDGGLRENAAALRAAVEHEVGALPFGVMLVAPWWGDGHRDHRVAGETALSLRGPGVRVLGYPIWLWHWADPDVLDTLVPLDTWRGVTLDPAIVAAKARALAQHVSQVNPLPDAADGAPIVHEGMAAHFTRRYELFVDADESAADSTDREVFDEYFRTHDDPWGFESSWYEERKRSMLLAALPRRRFTRALELGCANGVLTSQLAERADAVVGVDVSPVALAGARERLDGRGNVAVEQRRLPRDWPEGSFDLVVLSEIGYFWSPTDLRIAIGQMDASLTGDGVVVACHWRHPSADAPLLGDEVHAALAGAPRWTRTVRHLERDFVLEVFERRSAG